MSAVAQRAKEDCIRAALEKLKMTPTPKNLQLIGTEIAISWSDGTEDYFPSEFLRKHSPSAENKGETDILGQTHGGTTQTEFPGVTIIKWDFIGNYAIRFHFSDGHRTGLFSYNYLKSLNNILNT